MSVTNTGRRWKAAVPQEPAAGPMARPSRERLKASGRLGAAPCTRRSPASSSIRIETIMPSADCASAARAIASSTCGTGEPFAISSSTVFSDASASERSRKRRSLSCSDCSKRFRAWMSVFVPNQRTMRPCSSLMGSARPRCHR